MAIDFPIFNLPVIGGSTNTWGILLNNCLNNQDAFNQLVSAMSVEVDELKEKSNKAGFMTKVEYRARQEANRELYAGSGFVEWGKANNSVLAGKINQGLYSFIQDDNNSNYLYLGTENLPVGVSKSDLPVSNIAGNILKLKNIGMDSAFNTNAILFPPAPDGTKVYDSADGSVTQYATSNEAFEGIKGNGDMRNALDANDYFLLNIIDGSLVIENGILKVTGNSADYVVMRFYSDISKDFEVKEYTVNISMRAVNAPINRDFVVSIGGEPSYSVHSQVIGTEFSNINFRFTPNSAGRGFVAFSGLAGENFEVASVSIMESTKNVITERSDFVGLEYFEQEIDETNDFFLPLGGTQNYATTYEGIATSLLTTLGVSQGYSRFGDWDSTTVGRGIQWSTLTDAQKLMLAQIPENNIFYDAETGSIIQGRYRVRVVEGLGANWGNSVIPILSNVLAYYPEDGVRSRIMPQAGNSVPTQGGSDLNTTLSDGFYAHENIYTDVDRANIGAFQKAGANVENNFIIPIALVQRLNQGAFHPSYNPLGTKSFIFQDGSGANSWNHNLAKKPNSQSDCFYMGITGDYELAYAYRISGFLGASGGADWAIGRPDDGEYLYYDGIYAGLIEDLRISAHKQDETKLLEDAIKRAIKGETRGKQNMPYTHFITGSPSTSSLNIYLDEVLLGDNNFMYGYDKEVLKSFSVYTRLPKYIAVRIIDEGDTDILTNSTGGFTPVLNEWYKCQVATHNLNGMIAMKSASSEGWISSGTMDSTTIEVMIPLEMETELNELPWMDVVAPPERIKATFPDGFIGMWVDQDYPQNGQSPLNKKSVETPFEVLFSDDEGATWAGASPSTNWDAVDNSRGTNTESYDRIYLISYTANSNFTDHSYRGVVRKLSNSAFVSSDYVISRGNRLMESLSGQINKSDLSLITTYSRPTFSDNRYDYVTSTAFKISASVNRPTIFNPHRMSRNVNNGDAVFSLPYLVYEDGLMYVEYSWRQLIQHTDYSYGELSPATDTSNVEFRFFTSDLEAVATDFNGNTYFYGTQREMIPIGIVNYNDSAVAEED